jgi:hypothetical protein
MTEDVSKSSIFLGILAFKRVQMKKGFLFAIILIFFGFLSENLLLSSEPNQHLFHIERSRDADEIFYEAKLGCTGNLNIRNPIEIYWMKNTLGGTKEPLTLIQRRYSYGLKFLEVSEAAAIFQFVSFPETNFELRKNSDGIFRVFTTFNGSELEVNSLYVYFAGGSFWRPVISSVKLIGKETETGKSIVEALNP